MSLCIQVIAHWAVPVFFMLTGANLMDYREKYSTSVYFKRRMTRIFLPFLFWSTVYFIWKCALGWLSYTGARDLATAYLSNGMEGIFGAASMFTGTIWLSLRDGGALNDLLWGYMMYPTLFMACALFLLLKHCRWQILYKEKVQRVLAKLSGASFGVYLIHIMIVNALVVDGPVNGDSRWWMLFGAAGVYLICIGIVLVAKRIPGIKYLFP